MPILDTGMLLNRNHPNSITIAIRAVNRGRHHAVVGIQSYRFHSGSVRDEGEFGSEQVRTIRLVALAPAQQEESAFAISHTVQDLQSFGIRIVAGGPGGRDVAATAAELDADGNMLHIHPMPAVRTANRDEKGLAYVANHTQHSLTVIDTSTDTRIMTLPLNAGSSPRQVAITPDGSNVYVTCPGDKTVKVIDSFTQSIRAEIHFPANAVPLGAAIAPDGKIAYVSTLVADYIAIIDTNSLAILKLIPLPEGCDPSYIAVSPDGKHAYCCLISAGAVVVLDTSKRTISMLQLPEGSQPSALAITPCGTFIYVTDIYYERIYVIRSQTGTIVKTIALIPGSDPQSIVITPDGSLAYVANRGSDEIMAINLSRNEMLTMIDLPEGSQLSDLAVTSDGSKVYATVLTFGYVAVIDTQNHMPVAVLPTGSFPSGIAVTPIMLM